ncbi:hypothetical protein PAHAL_1G405700 [Panicum hallii]|uniref:Uncharacterized protein n=1 Tax=Panicum hallii TaxID=206008 RepID=A0A2T8KXZ9_9POAL|nr:hypothetical protein PAHAL_1G405700 [Panicum hallii]
MMLVKATLLVVQINLRSACKTPRRILLAQNRDFSVWILMHLHLNSICKQNWDPPTISAHFMIKHIFGDRISIVYCHFISCL